MNYYFTISKFTVKDEEYHVMCLLNEYEKKFCLARKITGGFKLRLSPAYKLPKSLIDRYTYNSEIHKHVKEAFDNEIVKMMLEVI